MFRSWIQPWANHLSSSLYSLLGKRDKEEETIQVETKRRKQGKAIIDKDVINTSLLDFISPFVDETKRRVEDLTEAEIESLKNKYPDINNWIDLESNEVYTTKIPQIWKTQLENGNVKKAFLVAINALGISLGDGKDPIFENSQSNYGYVNKLLQDYDSMKIDFAELELGIGKVIRISNHDEQLWKAAISPFKRQTFGKPSQQELSRSLFLPLFNFTSNLMSCSGNAFRSQIPDFCPDDFVVVEYKNVPCIRLIREDSVGQYNNHTNHKDFIALIFQMRLALGSTARNMIGDKLDKWHDMITILGISTDSTYSYVYSMHCIVDNSHNNYSISYILNYIGSFSHFEKHQRIELISKIITTLSTPNIGIVDECLQNYTGNGPIDMPKSFPIFFNNHTAIINLDYCNDNPSYCKNGKHLKIAKIVNSSIHVFVKHNSNPILEERSITRCLPLLSLYLPTFKVHSYSISFAGITLSECIRDKKRADFVTFFIDLFIQLCLLEGCNIIHNDIKPDNIVLFNEHWFLIDYEISLIVDGPATSPHFTKGYRSPERRDQLIVSFKSDIYSLGLVLLDFCKGKRSNEWESCNEECIVKEVDNFIPQKIKTYVKIMLKSNPNERLTSLELFEMLKEDGYEELLHNAYDYYSKKDRFRSLIPSKPMVCRSLLKYHFLTCDTDNSGEDILFK